MPPGDAVVTDLLIELEKALYRRLNKGMVHPDSTFKL